MSLITINLHVHADAHSDCNICQHLESLLERTESIMGSQAQLATDLAGVSAQVAKIGTETSVTLQKVIDLEAALANAGNTTPEVDAAMAALKAQVQLVDDLVPDAAP